MGYGTLSRYGDDGSGHEIKPRRKKRRKRRRKRRATAYNKSYVHDSAYTKKSRTIRFVRYKITYMCVFRMRRKLAGVRVHDYKAHT